MLENRWRASNNGSRIASGPGQDFFRANTHIEELGVESKTHLLLAASLGSATRSATIYLLGPSSPAGLEERRKTTFRSRARTTSCILTTAASPVVQEGPIAKVGDHGVVPA